LCFEVNDTYDAVLLDMNFRTGASSGEEGLRWMKKILRQSPCTSVILMTAFGEIGLAVNAIKEGAADFVVKPWDNERLLESMSAAVRAAQESHQDPDLQANPTQAPGALQMLGQSPAMEKVFNVLRKVGKTDASVLILGENGTGKEVLARALHEESLRAAKHFVHVDAGAIPESLFESELFGHKKGAFTDAREDRAGRFEHAHGGTLFLDEIGNLPLPLQAKLLTAIQSRQVQRLGTNTPIPVDIRLICATNMPLHEMVRDGRFRQDLLYRINTVEINLPPLRERGDDVHLIAQHYLQLFSERYKKGKMGISPAALAKLKQHPWPGNIRELQHAIERAVIMADGLQLQPDDFILQETDLSSDLLHHPHTLPANFNLEEVEKAAIKEAIQKHAGNLSNAAKELGLGRTTLYRKMNRYGI
jgi:two-component system response regulator HydG